MRVEFCRVKLVDGRVLDGKFHLERTVGDLGYASEIVWLTKVWV